jgi:hypothetical protein
VSAETCFYCRRLVYPRGSIEVRDDPYCLRTRDHMLPKHLGKQLHNNIVYACHGCNAIKNGFPLEVFMFFIRSQTTHKPVPQLMREMRQFAHDLTVYGLEMARREALDARQVVDLRRVA